MNKKTDSQKSIFTKRKTLSIISGFAPKTHSPAYRMIHQASNRSFVVKWEPFNLKTPWHYHPELELIYVVQGKVSGIIADRFMDFEEGDLILLGANFPHVLREPFRANVINEASAIDGPRTQSALNNEKNKDVDTETKYSKKKGSDKQSIIKPFGLILQFREDFMGDKWLNAPEMRRTRALIERARKGIVFYGDSRKKACEVLSQFPKLKPAERLLNLLQVLHILSECRSYTTLAETGLNQELTQDEERMRQIHTFIYQHFTRNISVNEVAKVANMTESSFCRYFKSRTLKTFTNYLNEIRISHACKLLKQDGAQVSLSALDSGFSNLSYFTRVFKRQLGMSPGQYRKQLRGEIATNLV